MHDARCLHGTLARAVHLLKHSPQDASQRLLGILQSCGLTGVGNLPGVAQLPQDCRIARLPGVFGKHLSGVGPLAGVAQLPQDCKTARFPGIFGKHLAGGSWAALAAPA